MQAGKIAQYRDQRDLQGHHQQRNNKNEPETLTRKAHPGKAISGEVVACQNKYVKEVSGYTVIDSKKAVEALSGLEYAQLFGASTERALIFTNVETGVLPMMIVRVSSLKPRAVVFHRTKPDEEAIRWRSTSRYR
jgi:predicted transcriptional regulator